MNIKLFIKGFTLLVFTGFILSAFTAISNDPWPVPSKYDKMKNPVSADKESIAIGKSLYTKHCKSCHGSKGLGDGTKAAQLDTHCGDFSTTAFQKQSDGAIFYKTATGREDMPSFKKKIPVEEDIWHVVNYVRTMK